MILHLRVVPSFWVAAEECRRPELRTRPVIIGGLPHQRGAVRQANFLAQQAGVQPGMALSQAMRHCPDGLFLSPDPPYYDALWERVVQTLQDLIPLVQPLEAGQAACDLRGLERSWPTGWHAAQAVSQRVQEATGIQPWIGVSSNRIVAELASLSVNAAGIAVIEPGQERRFLAGLPVSSLPELDPRLALTFQVLGITTLGQLAALPAAAVRQRFGSAGATLHAYARGHDRRAVLPPPRKARISASLELEDGSPEEAIAALQRLAERCAAELEERDLAGRLITLRLTWEQEGRGLTDPSRPVRDAQPALSDGASADAAALPAPPQQQPADPALSLPQRVHSRLPVPRQAADVSRGSSTLPANRPAGPNGAHIAPRVPPVEGASMAVRVALRGAVPLAERAERLLRQQWPRGGKRRLRSMELIVSEFEEPSQLSFELFNRLGETGGLSGIGVERRRTLAQQEQVLAARHGSDPFRHVARADPGNVLTERRVEWGEGLPPDVKRPARGKR